jgi:ATP-dependent Clp protease ATP-binding subunit ClpA
VFERFTTQARSAVVAATDAAHRLHSPHVGREHLLLGLAACGEATLAAHGHTAESLSAALSALPTREEEDRRALDAVGIDLDELRAGVEDTFGAAAWDRAAPRARRRGALARRLLGDHRPFSAGAKKALELALRETLADHAPEITATHCLRGVLRDPGPQVLRLLGADEVDRLRAEARRAA